MFEKLRNLFRGSQVIFGEATLGGHYKHEGSNLPSDFKVAASLGDIVFDKNGKRYAVKDGDGWEVRDLPADGKITHKDSTICVKVSEGGISVTMKGNGSTMTMKNVTSRGSISMRNGSIVLSDIRIGEEEESNVDLSFAAPEKLAIKSTFPNLELLAAPDSQLRIMGEVDGSPTLKKGTLMVRDLKGKAFIPDSCPEVDIEVGHGSISGSVAQFGSIKSTFGNITLEVTAPIEIRPSTTLGSISISGMIAEGNRYLPPRGESRGVLTVHSGHGKIRVKYRPQE